MSHVALVDITIQEHELDALAAALETLGCELRRDQRTYAWWGTSVGDYPLPAGMSKNDLGTCMHAIRVKGTNPVNGSGGPWEVGLWPIGDGKFKPVYDFFGSAGDALHRAMGEKLNTMKIELATEIGRRHMMRAGMRVTTTNVQTAAVR